MDVDVEAGGGVGGVVAEEKAGVGRGSDDGHVLTTCGEETGHFGEWDYVAW